MTGEKGFAMTGGCSQELKPAGYLLARSCIVKLRSRRIAARVPLGMSPLLLGMVVKRLFMGFHQIS